MRFLKTIQRRQSERPARTAVADPVVENGKKSLRTAPDELVTRDLKFGQPNTALVDELKENAGQTAAAAAASAAAPALAPVEEERDELAHVVAIDVGPSVVNPHLVAVTQPNSAYCEEYRSLRTHILHKSQKKKLQSLVVASVSPGEGKSVTALNLAWLLAQTDGIRALVIDCDLRRPCLTDYLGIETKVGLSEVFDGRHAMLDTIVRLDPAGLYLLPGGRARNDVAEVLSGPKFVEILREAREHFDYIVIDAPPLGIFTDATVLINQADGALLVVRANHSSYKDVDRVMERLPRERMLGAVLNYAEDQIISESNYYDYYQNKRYA